MPVRSGRFLGRRLFDDTQAIVILGGLFISTALNLLLLPNLALGYGRFEQTDASSK